MATPATWPSPSTTKVIEVEGCGRGVVAAVDIRAGAPILCEVALASMNLSSLDMEQDPMLTAASLAAALLVDSTVHGLTRALEPQTADGLVLDQAADAVAEMRRRSPASATVDDRELLRLFHVVKRNALELLGHQALCVRASMINHSCTPNATHMGFRRRADGVLLHPRHSRYPRGRGGPNFIRRGPRVWCRGASSRAGPSRLRPRRSRCGRPPRGMGNHSSTPLGPAANTARAGALGAKLGGRRSLELRSACTRRE